MGVKLCPAMSRIARPVVLLTVTAFLWSTCGAGYGRSEAHRCGKELESLVFECGVKPGACHDSAMRLFECRAVSGDVTNELKIRLGRIHPSSAIEAYGVARDRHLVRLYEELDRDNADGAVLELKNWSIEGARLAAGIPRKQWLAFPEKEEMGEGEIHPVVSMRVRSAERFAFLGEFALAMEMLDAAGEVCRDWSSEQSCVAFDREEHGLRQLLKDDAANSRFDGAR